MNSTATKNMEVISSDDIAWDKLFLEHELIVVNYQPVADCPGCKEMNKLYSLLAREEKYAAIKFLWVDSRSNPIAEQFIMKRQTAFIAVFKDGFLVECDNVNLESELRDMLERLFKFKFKF